MGSEHITLKIGSSASLMIDTRQGDVASTIRKGVVSAADLSRTDGVVIQDENSPLIIEVRWKNAAIIAEKTLTAATAAEIAGVDGGLERSSPIVGAVADDRLSQLITAEYQRIKQRTVEDGRFRDCSQQLQQLSAKETDVLILMIEGRSCKEIATRLRIGIATAAKHRMRILKKLNVRDTVELVQILLAVFEDANSLASRSNEHEISK